MTRDLVHNLTTGDRVIVHHLSRTEYGTVYRVLYEGAIDVHFDDGTFCIVTRGMVTSDDREESL